MEIDDQLLRTIAEAFDKADSFMTDLAIGNGFDRDGFEEFISGMRDIEPLCQQLPIELRQICSGLVEIPALMDSSHNIVSDEDAEDFNEAIFETVNVFANNFGPRSDELND